MSFLAKLYIDKEEFNILEFEFDFKRARDKTNKPVGLPMGGIIKLTLESNRKTDFLFWFLNESVTKDGRIVFFRRDAMSKMKELSFLKSYCIGYNEKFSSTTNVPMHTNLEISAREFSFGDAKFANDWMVL